MHDKRTSLTEGPSVPLVAENRSLNKTHTRMRILSKKEKEERNNILSLASHSFAKIGSLLFLLLDLNKLALAWQLHAGRRYHKAVVGSIIAADPRVAYAWSTSRDIPTK